MNVTRVGSLAIMIAGVGILVLLVSGQASSRAHESQQPEKYLDPNSCAISCPLGTPHGGHSGSVTCRDGYAPVCQCASDTEMMAFCELIPASR